jgi:origin recognition complex subunit 4
MHSDTAGHEVVSFEMLYECFYNQVRVSSAAPVQIEGGGIGMVKCTRDVLMSVSVFFVTTFNDLIGKWQAFEQLIAARLFVNVAPPSPNVAKEFVKYRCAVQRLDVKKAVEKMGKTNLKKWFSKAQ